MARSFIRATAMVGAFGLGLLAMSPAVAATDNQAGATALFLSIANNGQGTGTATATYEDGKETKTGETSPAFPQPAQDAFKLGVLAQEATATPGFSAACAGLAGDGGSVLNIGDSSCLKPGNALNGSLGNLDLKSLLNADPTAFPGFDQLPDSLKGPLTTLLGSLDAGRTQFDTVISQLQDAIGPAIEQATAAFGDGGLVIDLDAIQGRCTAGDGGPTGTSTLTNASIALKAGGKTIPIVNLPTDPAPNTKLVTNLDQVVQLIVNAIKTDLQSSIGAQSKPLQDAIDQATAPVIENIKTQLVSNLQPIEDNLISGVLNEQEHPTPDSIKVRALRVQVGTAEAIRNQVGASLVDLQIGDAACAPVARTATAVSPPQAVNPPVANPKTPTAVSSGLASVPDQQQGLDASTWALVALAGLGLAGASLVGARRLFN